MTEDLIMQQVFYTREEVQTLLCIMRLRATEPMVQLKEAYLGKGPVPIELLSYATEVGGAVKPDAVLEDWQRLSPSDRATLVIYWTTYPDFSPDMQPAIDAIASRSGGLAGYPPKP